MFDADGVGGTCGVEADVVVVIMAGLAFHLWNMRKLHDTVVAVVGSSARVRIGGVAATTGPEEAWEDQVDDGPHGGDTGAHDADVQFGR